MDDKVALVTGSTDGIGRITAQMLAQNGATVLVHGRSSSKIVDTVEHIRQATNNDRVYGFQANLGELEQVKSLADSIEANYSGLDILINNAGLGPGNTKNNLIRTLSADGYEMRFQVNYLATALLCQKLLPALKKRQGRIINIASAAQRALDFNDLMLETEFDASFAYAQSKLAVVIFTLYFAERIRDDKVTVNALDPGSFLNTRMVQEAYGSSANSPESGALAQLFLATSYETKGVTGQYFMQRRPTKAHEQAYESIAQKQLWHQTNELLSAYLSR